MAPHSIGHRPDQIVIAYRSAADRYDHISALGKVEHRAQAGFGIAGDGQNAGCRALGFGHGFQGKGVRRDNLIGARLFARHDQFIPGGDNRDIGAAGDCHLGAIHRGDQPQIHPRATGAAR